MRKILIVLGLCLLCANAWAVTPYEARTAWVGGSFWVDGSTGNTVEIIRGESRFNALYIKNDFKNVGGANATFNTIYINWNGAATESTSTSQNNRAMRYDTANPASATTVDFPLYQNEDLWLNPWCGSRVEITGHTIDKTGAWNEVGPKHIAGGYVRVLLLYAD